jgi:hypothetical protein
MGLSPSKEPGLNGVKQPGNVFSKELEKLEGLVNSVITPDGNFMDKEYNFLNDDVCNRYTMVMETALNKHLKVHLHDLAASVYFVPKDNDMVHTKSGDRLTKSELCSVITSHYRRTLRMLTLIRNIYDFENGGKYSLAGIVYRNLDQIDGMYQVSVCATEQEPLDMDENLVDFKKLKGLDMFVNSFLNKGEASTFIRHLKQLFGNYNKRSISRLICEDTIVTPKDYKEIYDDIRVQCGGSSGYTGYTGYTGEYVADGADGVENMSKDTGNDEASVKRVDKNKSKDASKDASKDKSKSKGSSVVGTKPSSLSPSGKRWKHRLLFKVGKDRPIISNEMCMDKQKYIVPYSNKMRFLFHKYKTDYIKNIDLVYTVVHKLVLYDFKLSKYKLRDLSYAQVTAIETELKRCVVIMFVQSMVNYFKILNHVKQIKHLKKTDG